MPVALDEFNAFSRFERSADWKSARRQVGNLRYAGLGCVALSSESARRRSCDDLSGRRLTILVLPEQSSNNWELFHARSTCILAQ